MTPTWPAEHTPDVPAIATGTSGEVVTYAQLKERSVRFARALRLVGADHPRVLLRHLGNRAGSPTHGRHLLLAGRALPWAEDLDARGLEVGGIPGDDLELMNFGRGCD